LFYNAVDLIISAINAMKMNQTHQKFFIRQGLFLSGTGYRGLECFKCRVHCFSMQVVMNKCFLLKPEKNLAQIGLAVFEKNSEK